MLTFVEAGNESVLDSIRAEKECESVGVGD